MPGNLDGFIKQYNDGFWTGIRVPDCTKKIAYESTDLFIRLYWSVGDMYLLQVRKHEYYRVLYFRRMDV